MVKLAFFLGGWASAAVDSCLRFLSELVPIKAGGLDADKRAEPVKASLAWEVLGCESFGSFARYCLVIISAHSASVVVFAMYDKSDQYVSSKS